MILSDLLILEEIEKRNIKIEPFDRECLGSNSYDLHLSKYLACYKAPCGRIECNCCELDAKEHNEIEHFEIPDEGILLRPGNLYLGSTVEYTETLNCVPCLEGKSSTARLGLFVHVTAGFGDVGFSNHWTLEMVATLPIRIYAGMPIAQIFYHITGKVSESYRDKKSAKYNERTIRPMESMMWKNKF